MGDLLSGIFNRECSRHALACRWWAATSSVEAVYALKIARRAIHSRELKPRHGALSLIALSLHRIGRGGRTARLSARQRADLLLLGVEVEERDAGAGEEVQARDVEVGRVGRRGVGAQVELQREAGEGVEDLGQRRGDAGGVVEGCDGADGFGDRGGVGGVAGVVLDAAADGDVL